MNDKPDDILGAIARGYCHLVNENKVVDTDLCSAIGQEVKQHLQALRDTPEYKEMRKALRSLYLATDESVANSVNEKVDAFLRLVA